MGNVGSIPPGTSIFFKYMYIDYHFFMAYATLKKIKQWLLDNSPNEKYTIEIGDKSAKIQNTEDEYLFYFDIKIIIPDKNLEALYKLIWK